MAMLVPGNEDEGSAVGAGDGQGGDDGNALTALRTASAGRGVEDAAAIVPSDDRPEPYGDDGLLAPPEQAAPMPRRRLEAALAAARAHAVLQEAVAQAVAGRAPSARSRAAALANTHDRDLFDRHLANGTEALRREGMAAGKAPAMIAQEASDYRSGIVRDHLDALGMRDPVHAAADLARLRDGISPGARRQIEDGLAPSIADHRAIADVDAAVRAGATSAPRTPPLDPRVLLGKMQVIAPTADAAALPGLVQRYGGDAAQAWAATQLGTKAVDGLIAQRGEGWYAALPEDTRHLVEHHMAMLAAPGSTRDAPEDVTGAAARIAAQDWPDDRKAAATRELLYRDHRAGQRSRDTESAATDQAYAMAEKLGTDFTSLAQIDPATRRLLPADVVADLTRQADANVHPAMGLAGMAPVAGSEGPSPAPSDPQGAVRRKRMPLAAGPKRIVPGLAPIVPRSQPAADPSLLDAPVPTPRSGSDIGALTDQLAQEARKPTGPLFEPIASGRVGGDEVVAAKVDPRDFSRLSRKDVLATPAMKAAAMAAIGMVRVQRGDEEIMAFGYLMPDGTIEVRPVISKGAIGQTNGADYVRARPSGPGKAIFVIHGHIERRKTGSDKPSDGMVDDTSIEHNRGDADGLAYGLPVATVYNGYIGWHEMKNGQLIFTVPAGAQSRRQLREIASNLASEQKKFYTRRRR